MEVEINHWRFMAKEPEWVNSSAQMAMLA